VGLVLPDERQPDMAEGRGRTREGRKKEPKLRSKSQTKQQWLTLG